MRYKILLLKEMRRYVDTMILRQDYLSLNDCHAATLYDAFFLHAAAAAIAAFAYDYDIDLSRLLPLQAPLRDCLRCVAVTLLLSYLIFT